MMGGEFFRYIVVGLINTAVGYLVYLIMLRIFDMSALAANAISYIFGLMVAYVMNLLFVFRSGSHSWSSAFRFITGFGVAYTVNAAVLLFALQTVALRAEIAQFFAMGAYTITFYLINKHFVWRS